MSSLMEVVRGSQGKEVAICCQYLYPAYLPPGFCSPQTLADEST